MGGGVSVEDISLEEAYKLQRDIENVFVELENLNEYKDRLESAEEVLTEQTEMLDNMAENGTEMTPELAASVEQTRRAVLSTIGVSENSDFGERVIDRPALESMVINKYSISTEEAKGALTKIKDAILKVIEFVKKLFSDWFNKLLKLLGFRKKQVEQTVKVLKEAEKDPQLLESVKEAIEEMGEKAEEKAEKVVEQLKQSPKVLLIEGPQRLPKKEDSNSKSVREEIFERALNYEKHERFSILSEIIKEGGGYSIFKYLNAIEYCINERVNVFISAIYDAVTTLVSMPKERVSKGFDPKIFGMFADGDSGNQYFIINKFYCIISSDGFTHDIGYATKVIKDIEPYSLVVPGDYGDKLVYNLEYLLRSITELLDKKLSNSVRKVKNLIDDINKYKPKYIDELSEDDARLLETMISSLINLSQLAMTMCKDVGNDVGKLADTITKRLNDATKNVNT